LTHTRPHRLPGPTQAITWVVYEVTVPRKPGGARAVCERSEWDALELARPGVHTLVLAGIASETEAEKLARGTAGDRPPRLATRL
jgi:hypothetical protein